MNELLLDYLPLVIFIAVALAIAVVLLLTPFVIAYKQPIPRSFPPTNVASTPSMMRA